MLKMYALTVLVSIITCTGIVLVCGEPSTDTNPLIFFSIYWIIALQTLFASAINVADWDLPKSLELGRIPFAACVLGANSSLYHSSFIDEGMQRIRDGWAVKGMWLGFETVLTVILIIGIIRWSVRHPAPPKAKAASNARPR